MDVGLLLVEPPNAHEDVADIASPRFLNAVARRAEELGFYSIVFGDHVVWPVEYSSLYPYQSYEDGEFKPCPWEGVPFPDPVVAMSYVAAVTTRIRLGTGMVILPQRNPVVLAKELATLDALSGGRVDLGVGMGWSREEMDAVGFNFEDRGRRGNEYIEAMRELWSKPEATYAGQSVSFERVQLAARPSQDGGPRIIIGGNSKAAARRAARLGDGFWPAGLGAGEPWEFVEEMHAECERIERDAAEVELFASTVASDEVLLEEYASRGITHFISAVPKKATLEATLEMLEETAAVAGDYLHLESCADDTENKDPQIHAT